MSSQLNNNSCVKRLPSHNTRNWALAHGFLGPKGALFYQQFQCCWTRQGALLCNKLVKKRRLPPSSNEFQWNYVKRVAARLILKGVPPGTCAHSPFCVFFFSPKCLFECPREMKKGQKVGDQGFVRSEKGWLIPALLGRPKL